MAAAAGGATCMSSGCDKPATMLCPTCKELSLPGWFCGQTCFKSNWSEHKLFHTKMKELLAAAAAAAGSAPSSRLRMPKSFEGFSFTGKLRPGHVSARKEIPKSAGIVLPDYAATGIPRSEDAVRGSNVIHVHTAEEIEYARKAGRIGREVLDIAAAHLKPGVTGEDIDNVVFQACLERGVYPSPLNYRGFPKSVCVSVNEVICHGIPDDRPFADGDLVNLDVSIYTSDGFHSDLNETYIVGSKINEKGRKLVQCAYECLRVAVGACKPGVMYRDLGTLITRTAGAYGFSVVTSFCGHGVGRLFHGAPNVPHYAKNKAVGYMKAGSLAAVQADCLPALQCLAAYGYPLTPDLAVTAAALDRRAVLSFMRAHGVEWHAAMCRVVARRGGLDTLQWLRAQEPPCPWDGRVIVEARLNGFASVAAWARENGCPEPGAVGV